MSDDVQTQAPHARKLLFALLDEKLVDMKDVNADHDWIGYNPRQWVSRNDLEAALQWLDALASPRPAAPPDLEAIKTRLQAVCYGYRWADVLMLCDEIERLRSAAPVVPPVDPEGQTRKRWLDIKHKASPEARADVRQAAAQDAAMFTPSEKVVEILRDPSSGITLTDHYVESAAVVPPVDPPEKK